MHSPWSAGVPPGVQIQQPLPQPQFSAQIRPMFSQPMASAPFDAPIGWQQPWASMQQQQHQQHQANNNFFIPNQIMSQPIAMNGRPQHQFGSRPMQQRSQSAPRVGNNQFQAQRRNNFNANNKPNNSYNSSNGSSNFTNNNNNSNNNKQINKAAKISNKVNIAKNANNNNDSNNNKAQSTSPNQQQQQQSKPVKVSKAKKRAALKAKNQGAKGQVKADAGKVNDVKSETNTGESKPQNNAPAAATTSRSAERKQRKIEDRKNAESLEKAVFPVKKSTANAKVEQETEDLRSLIDQAQLKCVPAVFGFVCKLCDVFLRDKHTRREHIDSEEHMKKFNEQQSAVEAMATVLVADGETENKKDEQQSTSEVASVAMTTQAAAAQSSAAESSTTETNNKSEEQTVVVEKE